MHKSTRRRLVIPIFVPHVGCPRLCVFCNQRSISGNNNIPSRQETTDTIEQYLEVANRYDVVEVAFFGGSFTAIHPALQEDFLSCVYPYIGKGVDYVRISTRPDCINDEILMRLKKYRVHVIELGAQSMDDKVLEASLRGHTSRHTIEASELIKREGFVLGLQTMPGLPMSDRNSDIETAKKIAALGPDLVRIYPTIIIKKTHLETMYRQGKYEPQTLEYMIDLCAELVEIYEKEGIDIARIGLQSSENMTEEKEIVAGPYHPAFGQLVHSRRALQGIVDRVREMRIGGGKVLIRVPEKELSTYIGQRRSNVLKLKEMFNFEDVRFIPDPLMDNGFVLE